MTMLQPTRYAPETPSKLKTQVSVHKISSISVVNPRRRSSVSSINSEENRSLVQAYCLVGKVRARLRREVDEPIANLRRLVGHVNVLDEIMDTIYGDEQQEEGAYPDFSVLERQQSDSSTMLLQSVDGDWMEDDESGESVSSDSDEESGCVIEVRQIHNPPPQRPPPPRPVAIDAGS